MFYLFLIPFLLLLQTSNGVYCLASEVKITMGRVFTSKASEESFSIHSGTSIYGTRVYNQPTIYYSGSYTWETCLNPGFYTMHLKDSKNDGWSSGSSLKLYMNNIYEDTYRLYVGSSSSFLLYIPGIQSFSYQYSTFTIAKNCYFIVIPTVTGTSGSFSVYSGYLPVGLSISSLGMISGTPTKVQNTYASIICSTTYNSISVSVSFRVVNNPTSCPSNKMLIRMNRHTNRTSSQEDYYIYKGTNTSGTLVYSQLTVLDNRNFNWNACFSPGDHVLRLIDSGGNGWSQGSYLNLYFGDTLLDSFTLSSNSSAVIPFFVPSLFSFSYPLSYYVLFYGTSFSASPTTVGVVDSYSIMSGSLPTGLSFNSNTGRISGVPTSSVLNRKLVLKASNSEESLNCTIYLSVLENAIGCTNNYVLVQIRRVTKENAINESFKIYEGNTIRVTQPYLQDSSTYTWNTCLSPVAHTLQMTTTSGTAWTTNSTIKLTFPTGTVSFHSNSTSETISFPTVKPSVLHYSTPFVLNLNTTFSSMPTFIGNALSFSLVSGSLPNGITLNPTTGQLSGIPTTLGSNQQVTIKASNLLGEIQSTITMSVIPYPISCADGSTLIHIERQTKIDVSRESFKIFNGNDTSNTPAFSQPPLANDYLYSWNACLNNGENTIQLISTSSSGWYTGSTVKISVDGGSYQTFTLQSLSLRTLSLSLIPPVSLTYTNSTYIIPRNLPFTLNHEYTGGSCAFHISSGSLPIGLVLNEETGIISGTPTQSIFNQQVTISAHNPIGSVTTILTFNVLLLPSSLSYSPSSINQATSTNVMMVPTVIGDSISYRVSDGVLPTGLSLSDASGTISGVVYQSTPFRQVTIQAYNTIGSTSTILSFQFTIPPSEFYYTPQKSIIPVSREFSISPNIKGDPCTFILIQGTLPTGLSLNSTSGEIFGIPTLSSSLIQLKTKASNNGGSKTTSLSIRAMTLPSISYSITYYSYIVNDQISIKPSLAGDDIAVRIKSGELPTGLSLNEKTGEISGTAMKRVSECKVDIEVFNTVGTASEVIIFHIQLLSTVTWIILCIAIVLVILLVVVLMKYYRSKPKQQLPITKPSSKKKVLRKQQDVDKQQDKNNGVIDVFTEETGTVDQSTSMSVTVEPVSNQEGSVSSVYANPSLQENSSVPTIQPIAIP